MALKYRWLAMEFKRLRALSLICKTPNTITHADDAWLVSTHIINNTTLYQCFELEINLKSAQVHYVNIWKCEIQVL